MVNIIVPKPEDIFVDKTAEQIHQWADHTEHYLCYSHNQDVCVLLMFHHSRMVYVIYNTFEQLPSDALSDLQKFGFLVILSRTKCTAHSEVLKNKLSYFFINNYWGDMEFVYYDYL